MTTPTLSFCITTRNRSGFLRDTLASLAEQATEEVEIVVVDAASEDETPEVVASFSQVLPQLRYERRSSNGGIDRDYARAAELARGRYCWFFSDDDVLVPGAVERVLTAAAQDYSLIIANSEDRDADLKMVLRHRRLDLAGDRVYSPAEHVELFEDTAAYLSFIPGVIVRSDIWHAREKERFFGSLFAHVGVLFQEPLPGEALVLAEPLISIRNGTVSWAGRSFEIWMFLWPELVWSLSGLPEVSRRRVTVREPWRRLRELLVYRAMAAFSMNEYRVRIADAQVGTAFRWSARLVATSPGRLVNALAIVFCLVTDPHNRFTLYNLRRSLFYWRNAPNRVPNGGRGPA